MKKTDPKVVPAPVDMRARGASGGIGTRDYVAGNTAGLPPQILDHELLRCIGRGSYGEVWLARNALGSLRAVKIVRRDAFGDHRPFEREFEGIQRFEPISRSHESQVQILHVGINEPGGYFYCVMELADDASVQGSEFKVQSSKLAAPEIEPRTLNLEHRTLNSQTYTPRTLRSEMERRGHLPPAECVELGVALTTALEHLHGHGLVHRDIKPSNIIFVNGRPKLADIGLVTDAGDAKSIVGTEGYLPPEGPGTAQADIYSLGKVLYEISTGRDRRHFPDLPLDLGSLPDRNELLELNEVLLKAGAHDSQERYASAAEMRADLELLQRGRSIRHERTMQRRLTVAKKFSLSAAALLLFAGGIWLLANRFGAATVQRSTAPLEVNSIAVLPFVSENQWPPYLYLGDAFSEETMNALSHCVGLRVAPRRAAFAFKNATNDFQRIGEQLGVRTVLAGNMSRISNQFHVAARLLEASNGVELWSASYHQRSTNIGVIAIAVASNIARVLNVPLADGALRGMETNFAWKMAAYRLYKQASTNISNAAADTQDGMHVTIELLTRTLNEDPDCARAYADLAYCYAGASGWLLPPSQAMTGAEMSAHRALELDDSLAKANIALGMVCGAHRLDFTSAEVHFRRAIEKAPRDCRTYASFADFLSFRRRYAEADQELAKGERIDPQFIPLLAAWCRRYCLDHRYDEMLEQATRLSSYYPDTVAGLLFQARAYERLTNYPKALELAQRMKQLDPSPDFIAFLGMVHARMGHTNEAQQARAEVNAMSQGRRGLPPYEALILLGLGDTNGAIEKLESAVKEYPPNILFLKLEMPLWDELHSDPRIIELLKKAGLEK